MTSLKRPAIYASLALLAFAAALFFPALFQGKILAPLDITTTMLEPWTQTSSEAKPHNHAPVDAVTQYLPYRMFVERSLREDGYIGWNPFEMGGYSLAANTMALPAAWTMQLHRFLPFKDAWNLGLLAEFLTAGIGMLVFLRHRKLPWIACLLGAIAYMANSQFIIWIYHRWALGSFCWMPWVLWSVADGFRWRSPSPRHLLLPCFLALALLGGTLQHMAFVVLACGCLFFGSISKPEKALAEWPSAIAWTVAFILASVMAAFSIIPQISAYLTNISIGHVRGGIGYELGPTQPLFQFFIIPTQIWPWLVGAAQTIDGFRLFKCGFMSIAYIGTIPMVLALWGLFRKSMPLQAKWLILSGLIIPLTPLVGPFYHRVQLLFILGAAWMAAEMLADLWKNPSPRLIRAVAVIVSIIGIGLVIGTLLPSGIRNSLNQQIVSKALASSSGSSLSDDRAWIEQRTIRWTSGFSLANGRTAWVYGLLVAGTVALACTSGKNSSLRPKAGVLVLAITALELFTFYQSWTTWSNPRELPPEHPAIDAIRSLAGHHRVLQRAPGVGFTDMFATPNLLAASSIPSVDAYESIQYRSSLVVLESQPARTRLALAGVGLSVQPVSSSPADGTGSWPVVKTINDFDIRTNPDVQAPIAAGTGHAPSNPADILASLKISTPVTATLQTMNRITFTSPAMGTWIRIAQNWHEGWQWRTKDREWSSCREGADSACWIDLPTTGTTEIEVRFFPRPQWLLYSSFMIAALWAIVLLVSCARHRGAKRLGMAAQEY